MSDRRPFNVIEQKEVKQNKNAKENQGHIFQW
jgi:hypothetical protein